MSKLLTLEDIDVRGKKIFLRVDYNVIVDGKIIDEFRVRSSLPTIKYLLSRDCSIILASHNGRPGGKKVDDLSLRPVAKLLPRLLNRDVTFLDDCVGEEVHDAAVRLRPGDIMLLENLRFHPEEEANDAKFAKELASLAEVYVDDAFGVLHHGSASTVALPKLLPHAAGRLVQEEYEVFENLMHKPARPYTAVIGGAKISDKLDVLHELIKHVDALLIGGAMANTFLSAAGNKMRSSKVEHASEKEALAIISSCIRRKVKIVLPSDLIVSKEVSTIARGKVVQIDRLKTNDMALDIGPETAEAFATVIKDSKTVFWNGTMGVAEIPAFAHASDDIAHAMISSHAKTIVGGGDTAAFVDHKGLAEHFSFVSTGGGASLDLLAGKKLPGLEVLMQRKARLNV